MTDQIHASEPVWQRSARRLVESNAFQNRILAVIIVNAVTIGVQTYPIPGWLHTVLESTDRVFLGVFVVELFLRLAADGFQLTRFFRSGWNVFDFFVVAAAFIPGVSRNGTVLRLVGLVDRSTTGAEELEHRVEDHLHPSGALAEQSEPRR